MRVYLGGRPVVEADKLGGADSQQGAAVDLLDVEPRLDLRGLLEVAEDAHGGAAFTRGKHTRVVTPHKAERGAVALVAPGQGGVDYVLPVAAHRHEAAVGAVHEAAWVHVTAAQVLHRQWQPLTIRLHSHSRPSEIVTS